MLSCRRLSLVACLALVASLALAGGCASSAPESELTVFAAASLNEAFAAVAADYERAHPSDQIVLSFAGSQSLRTQIENGAKPDVFASANHQHIALLRDAQLVGDSTIFAHNKLVIVVPPDNPARIRSLGDLVSAKRLVLAETSVPAGAYAEQVLANASSNPNYGAGFSKAILERVVSRELHVRQTLQKVVLGEADAAIVYATDAASAGDRVVTIEIADELNIRASYPVVTVNGTSRSELAERFIGYLRSESGSAALERYGFRPAGVITAGR